MKRLLERDLKKLKRKGAKVFFWIIVMGALGACRANIAPLPPTIPPITPNPTYSAPVMMLPSATVAVITTVEATPAPTVMPSAAPLVYVFPIQPIEAASYLCGHHDYPATDIHAPEGTQFVAVTSGVVDWVMPVDEWDGEVDDPVTRSGLAIAIIGDDGVRYYGSHLSAIADGITVGARVTAGQVLGLTGTTGNARGTDPHLHFGISHPTTPDDWEVRRGEIDPCDYLAAWAAGEALTPLLDD